MDASIVIALILGFSSIVSSICFGLIPGINKRKFERIEKKVHTMAQDIDSFYAIEQELLKRLSEKTGTNIETLKKDVRGKVKIDKRRSLSNYSKPSMLAQEL